MKTVKVGGGGIDKKGEWYRYDHEVQMTDEEHAEWLESIKQLMEAPRESSSRILMSNDAYEAFRAALDEANPNE